MTTNTAIIFATSNKGKFAWLQRSLAIAGLDEWKAEMRKMDLLEIQSEKIDEISLFKARQAYALVQQPVLVMDGGFYIKELNGFPGPFVRYMIDQMGPYHIGALAGTLTDRSCHFENVATYIEAPDDYQQFRDTTGDIFTLSDQVWPRDHPQQWSPLWRILVPSGMGYKQPLASMDDDMLQDYAQKRALRDADSSCLNHFIGYLKEKSFSLAKFGT